MEFKVIKDEVRYQELLKQAEELVKVDPPLGSEDADKLELLVVLIEDYERRQLFDRRYERATLKVDHF